MTAPWGKTAVKPCGTYAAWQRHKRRQEKPCEACAAARAQYLRQRYRDPGWAMRRAREDALEALAHRHPEEFRRLYGAALQEARDQDVTS